MSEIIYNLENVICGFPLVILLMSSHIYFTIKLKFPQKYTFKGLKYMIGGNKKNTSEGISSFKSLMAVLASTLGLISLPITFSITIITARYPSNAGKGIKLIKPTLTDKYANKESNMVELCIY